MKGREGGQRESGKRVAEKKFALVFFTCSSPTLKVHVYVYVHREVSTRMKAGHWSKTRKEGVAWWMGNEKNGDTSRF